MSAEAVAFSPDEKIVAVGLAREFDRKNPYGFGSVKLWRVADRQELAALRGNQGCVSSIIFLKDGEFLVSGSADGFVRFWNLMTFQEDSALGPYAGGIVSLALSPDGLTMAIAIGSKPGQIKLINVPCKKEINTLLGHTSKVTTVAFSPDGRTLASGGGWGAAAVENATRIHLWDTTEGKPLAYLAGQRPAVTSVAFSPDGKVLFSTGIGGSIQLWDLSSFEQISWTGIGCGRFGMSLSVSPDGKTLATGDGGWDREGYVKIWDIAKLVQPDPDRDRGYSWLDVFRYLVGLD